MTDKPFLALITPLGSGASQPPVGSSPPGYPTHPWMPPYGPSHPIAPGGPPPGIWGPIGNYPDAGFPGPQPGQPPRPWGPINYPDQGLPGNQPYPSHPIYYPPVIWDPSRPTNPIVNPGDPNNPAAGQGEGERTPKVEWKSAWSPSTGWIVVGVPTGEHVTPSETEEQ